MDLTPESCFSVDAVAQARLVLRRNKTCGDDGIVLEMILATTAADWQWSVVFNRRMMNMRDDPVHAIADESWDTFRMRLLLCSTDALQVAETHCGSQSERETLADMLLWGVREVRRHQQSGSYGFHEDIWVCGVSASREVTAVETRRMGHGDPLGASSLCTGLRQCLSSVTCHGLRQRSQKGKYDLRALRLVHSAGQGGGRRSLGLVSGTHAVSLGSGGLHVGSLRKCGHAKVTVPAWAKKR